MRVGLKELPKEINLTQISIILYIFIIVIKHDLLHKAVDVSCAKSFKIALDNAIISLYNVLIYAILLLFFNYTQVQQFLFVNVVKD